MDAVLALLDDTYDFCDAHFAGVIDFQRATGDESQIVDREKNGVENRFVPRVEWTIDKNVLSAQTNSLPSSFFETLADYCGNGSLNGFSPQLALVGRCLHFGQAMNVAPSHRAIPIVDDDLTLR